MILVRDSVALRGAEWRPLLSKIGNPKIAYRSSFGGTGVRKGCDRPLRSAQGILCRVGQDKNEGGLHDTSRQPLQSTPQADPARRVPRSGPEIRRRALRQGLRLVDPTGGDAVLAAGAGRLAARDLQRPGLLRGQAGARRPRQVALALDSGLCQPASAGGDVRRALLEGPWPLPRPPDAGREEAPLPLQEPPALSRSGSGA